ncbi:MAG: type II secretion system protein, partial [Actinomycetota bacterium]|nr:type II secretion system protein [Actinomycetota bacterium]
MQLKRRRDQQGFTLVELTVVVLILSILVAFAVAAFVSARTRSEDRVAQIAARQAFSVMRVVESDGDLSTLNGRPASDTAQIVADFAAEEANLQWVATSSPSTGPHVVSARSADQTYLAANVVGVRHAFAVASESSICWMMG